MQYRNNEDKRNFNLEFPQRADLFAASLGPVSPSGLANAGEI